MKSPGRRSRPGRSWLPHAAGWPLLGLFLVLLLLVLNVSLLMIYRQVRGTIEEELGARLVGIATATAAGIDEREMRALDAAPEGPDELTGPDLPTGSDAPAGLVGATGPDGSQEPADADAARRRGQLRKRLQLILYETGLGEVYVVGEDYEYLLDAAGNHPRGYAHPALDLHFGVATAAMAGVAAASDLYRAGQVYLKTAFAPIHDDNGAVIGAVGVEGGSSFFVGLWQVRRQVLVTGMIGVAVVLALALFFGRVLRTQAQAERTLRETATLAAAGELAAILAHEIRNPLAVISSRAERVQAKIRQGKPPEELSEWFEAIPREIDRLNRVLSQYLAFARPTELEGGAADVEGTFDAVFALLEGDFKRKGVAVERTRAQGEVARVQMAPAALHQVLLNLLLNARDAMPGGGTVATRLHRAGETIVVEVGDTGCGMTPDQQRKAFESFYTTKEHGSGLGLAVVRSMLELYGGSVAIDSRVGEGTTFRLTMPAASAR